MTLQRLPRRIYIVFARPYPIFVDHVSWPLAPPLHSHCDRQKAKYIHQIWVFSQANGNMALRVSPTCSADTFTPPTCWMCCGCSSRALYRERRTQPCTSYRQWRIWWFSEHIDVFTKTVGTSQLLVSKEDRSCCSPRLRFRRHHRSNS